MPRKKGPVLDGDVIARAIAKDLPGWTLSQKRTVSDDFAAESAAKGEPGVTINTLRNKFLGPDADSDSIKTDTGPEDYGALERGRVTVQVEPEDGGPTKVADIVGGKAKIVQG